MRKYDPEQKLRLVIDGVQMTGTGFLLILYVVDKDVAKGVKIIHSGSNLLPLDRDFSCMEAKAIALDRDIVRVYWVSSTNKQLMLRIESLKRYANLSALIHTNMNKLFPI